ncbi:MAG: tRNA dihydrouridine synthase [Pseudomonadota bacterium]
MITKGKPALILAPMDGVTDALMRTLLTRHMPFSYCVSEFVRVSQSVVPRHVFRKEVPEIALGARTPSGTQVGVQILGGDPERMARSAAIAVAEGALVIDINFGCPAPTVNRHDGGATLLKFPERIETIVAAVRSAVPATIPVSAKLRLGWDDPSAIFLNSERASRGGASWITIHGRTKMQGYTPPAYWKPIGEVRRALDIPVVANGEIWSLDDLKRCQDESGCEHFMLGRGALSDPDLVRSCAEYLEISTCTAKRQPQCGDTLWRELIDELVSDSRSAKESDRRTLSRVKQWLNYAHHRRSISWFDSIKRAHDTRELSVLLDQIVGLPKREPRLAA